ncbi:hypothetical protein RHGRI_011561 [Rhododendron griersonianum]|uniref:Uncharacterized protein n=1 Tax=Rhododendron griersonianum TaxID=479676 RepID=A0AAV6KMT3_9ERIC|nr:hypothetical protein RHGRI_011561 [Rhododendron griersonianum]
MMISTKPMSSPSRTEKFPPPLMRFLKSNVGGRSRGKSRSSPMFIRKKNTTAVETTREPSSPKVTCIGQVRAHRPTSSKPRRCPPCRWVKNTLFCPHFFKQIKPKSFCSGFCKWVGSFRLGWCGKAEVRDETVEPEDEENRGNEMEDQSVEKEEEEEEEVEVKLESCEGLDSSTITLQPPKNAFLLTRCRSAPYRSSSLANRFWGNEAEKVEDERETEDGNGAEKAGEERETEDGNGAEKAGEKRETEDGNGAEEVGEERETEGPTSEVEPDCRDSSVSESRIDEEEIEPNLSEIADSIDGKAEEIIRVQEAETTRDLVLTRCKSEPARTGERLNPAARLWREREGLVLTEPAPSPRVSDY